MNYGPSFHTASGAHPDAPAPDAVAGRMDAPPRIAGQSDAERIEAHILTLRRFTQLALNEAERLDERAAEAHEDRDRSRPAAEPDETGRRRFTA